MGIPISSGFNLSTNKPVDLKTVKADLASRNAIPSTDRFQGLKVFVTSEQKNYQLLGGLLDANWVEAVSVPSNGLFEWISNTFSPYTVTTAGAFDSSASDPSSTTRLNYDGYLYATRLYDAGLRVSTAGHAHTGTYEPVLGSPTTNNEIVVSSTLGVRSWATIASLLPIATYNTLGVIKVGAYLTVDTNGVLNGQAGGTGGGGVWGTITGTLADQTDLTVALGLKAPLISPSFTTPILGTPTSGTLTNCTLPYSGLTGVVPTWNQNTSGTAANATNAVNATNATKLVTAEMTVEQTGTGATTKLVTKFGATTILSINNDGVLTSVTDIVAYGSA